MHTKTEFKLFTESLGGGGGGGAFIRLGRYYNFPAGWVVIQSGRSLLKTPKNIVFKRVIPGVM